MDEYRLVNKKFNTSKSKPKKSRLLRLLNLTLLSALIFVINIILCKSIPSYKKWITANVYSNNFSFAKIEELYKKYFGNVIPSINSDVNESLAVSSEKISYSDLEEIDGGVKLYVDKNSSVVAFQSGVVVYSGVKDEKNTIIIEQTDGKEAWYVDVDLTNINIYDYIEKGSILTKTNDSALIMYFKDNGEVIDYKEYIY